MDKTKINILQNCYTTKVQVKSKLTDEDRRAFMYLLSSEKIEEERLFLEQDDIAQHEFNTFLDDYENGECFFVGFHGTGKSAFLHNYFHLESSKNYWINNDTMLFYFGRNSIIDYRSNEDSLIAELLDLCKFLEKEYNITDDLYYELYNFIINTKRSVVKNPYLNKRNNTVKDYIKELQNLEKERSEERRVGKEC